MNMTKKIKFSSSLGLATSKLTSKSGHGVYFTDPSFCEVSNDFCVFPCTAHSLSNVHVLKFTWD